MKTILLALIRLYRFCISPLFPPSCRFHPSCSAYSLESIERFGIVHGCWLSLKRILKCHPWNCGGFDPVPEIDPKRES